MTSTQRWLTRQDYARLQNELVALRSQSGIEVPDDLMDYDANLVVRHSARQTRIGEIEDQLANAVVDGDPVGDPIARAGMVLTIRYDATGETETFLLGRRSAEDAGIDAYPMTSPLGRAIVGARPGDRRSYTIPNDSVRLVTLLEALPYELYVAKRPRQQAGFTVTRR